MILMDRACIAQVPDIPEEKSPRPDTKLLLRALNKALPAENLKLKTLKKSTVELQGPMPFPRKAFAAIENLVRLSI